MTAQLTDAEFITDIETRIHDRASVLLNREERCRLHRLDPGTAKVPEMYRSVSQVEARECLGRLRKVLVERVTRELCK